MFFELATLGLLGLESDNIAERQVAQARLARNPLLAFIAKPAGPESEHVLRRTLDPWVAAWMEFKAATFVEAVLDDALDDDCPERFAVLEPNFPCFDGASVPFVDAVYTQWAERRGWYGLSRLPHTWRGNPNWSGGANWGQDVMTHYWRIHHAQPEVDPL